MRYGRERTPGVQPGDSRHAHPGLTDECFLRQATLRTEVAMLSAVRMNVRGRAAPSCAWVRRRPWACAPAGRRRSPDSDNEIRVGDGDGDGGLTAPQV